MADRKKCRRVVLVGKTMKCTVHLWLEITKDGALLRSIKLLSHPGVAPRNLMTARGIENVSLGNTRAAHAGKYCVCTRIGFDMANHWRSTAVLENHVSADDQPLVQSWARRRLQLREKRKKART